ncbi:type II toxin-antitoxin system PemK/MazF family toxin [Candidatus Saccharibacteria bacterium]|nr:type II toxin-antitoxin system PemK/MazF family toxin [Candidatus Saccharibacteria bacterium]
MEKHELLRHWNVAKENLHNLPERKIQLVRDGEVWWVGIGENVGVEINGKSEYFSRPVLVLKKLSRFGFMGVPLTSQEHNGKWYAAFEFKGIKETAVLSQARVYSASRLYSRIGQVPDSDLELVRDGFLELYSK